MFLVNEFPADVYIYLYIYIYISSYEMLNDQAVHAGGGSERDRNRLFISHLIIK